ncbi:MAG: DUF4249 family protein, partial [bacterium]|nr:DUF4249 family protein [Candidatus Limimorpha equi]
MKRKNLLVALLSLMTLFSCKEDIIVDLENGEPLIGIEASFTDVQKHHEAILSYTADFYNSSDIVMISGARVCVTDGFDTIPYLERSDMPGHYFTDSVAGKKKTLYRLIVDVPDETEPDGWQHLFAESYMQDNVEVIDSLVVKPYYQPFTTDTLLMEVVPYFQSLQDSSIIYMLDIWRNDTLRTDTLSQKTIIPMGGYAGYYVNGPEMLENNYEISVASYNKDKLTVGDHFRVDFYSIPNDYMLFYLGVLTSMGSNPMMGPPSNVDTNIQPKGKGVGWFYAASVVSAE